MEMIFGKKISHWIHFSISFFIPYYFFTGSSEYYIDIIIGIIIGYILIGLKLRHDMIRTDLKFEFFKASRFLINFHIIAILLGIIISIIFNFFGNDGFIVLAGTGFCFLPLVFWSYYPYLVKVERIQSEEGNKYIITDQRLFYSKTLTIMISRKIIIQFVHAIKGKAGNNRAKFHFVQFDVEDKNLGLKIAPYTEKGTDFIRNLKRLFSDNEISFDYL